MALRAHWAYPCWPTLVVSLLISSGFRKHARLDWLANCKHNTPCTFSVLGLCMRTAVVHVVTAATWVPRLAPRPCGFAVGRAAHLGPGHIWRGRDTGPSFATMPRSITPSDRHRLTQSAMPLLPSRPASRSASDKSRASRRSRITLVGDPSGTQLPIGSPGWRPSSSSNPPVPRTSTCAKTHWSATRRPSTSWRISAGSSTAIAPRLLARG